MLLNRLSVITLMLLTLGSSIAFAQPNPNPTPSPTPTPTPIPTPTKKPDPNVTYPGGLPKDLNLTPQQIQQIREVRRKNPARELIQRKRDQLRQAQQEFLKLMAGNAPRNEVNTKYRQINNIKEQIANAEYQDDLDIREILNSTQRQKWVEHLRKRFPAPPNQSTQNQSTQNPSTQM